MPKDKSYPSMFRIGLGGSAPLQRVSQQGEDAGRKDPVCVAVVPCVLLAAARGGNSFCQTCEHP